MCTVRFRIHDNADGTAGKEEEEEEEKVVIFANLPPLIGFPGPMDNFPGVIL